MNPNALPDWYAVQFLIRNLPMLLGSSVAYLLLLLGLLRLLPRQPCA